jgi:hypothetical protein
MKTPPPPGTKPMVPKEKLIATLRDLSEEALRRGLMAAARELRDMADRMQAEVAGDKPVPPAP